MLPLRRERFLWASLNEVQRLLAERGIRPDDDRLARAFRRGNASTALSALETLLAEIEDPSLTFPNLVELYMTAVRCVRTKSESIWSLSLPHEHDDRITSRRVQARALKSAF